MSAALITSEVKAAQQEHPDWSFEQAWDFVESNRPELFSHSSAEGNRIRAKGRPEAELVQAQHQAKVERLARHLMSKNPRMTMGQALESVKYSLPRIEAEIKKIGRAALKAVEEPWPKGKMLMVRGSEGFFVE